MSISIYQPTGEPMKPVKTPEMSQQEFDDLMAEYTAEIKEWKENQGVPQMSEHIDDPEHGPAFDEKLKGAHPDHGHADDVEHGPAFDDGPKGHKDDVKHGPGVE